MPRRPVWRRPWLRWASLTSIMLYPKPYPLTTPHHMALFATFSDLKPAAQVTRLSAWQKKKLEEEHAAILRPTPTPNSLQQRTNSSPSPPPDFGDFGSLSPTSGEPRTPRQVPLSHILILEAVVANRAYQ